MKSHPMKVDIHEEQILENQKRWEDKPLLREIYRGFHERIARQLSKNPNGKIVELGSGIGNIKETIPACIRTDLFPNPWIDQVENAYTLSFADQTISDLILFDVFHHFRYPGTALNEFLRVLQPGGRVIIFDPCISALGMIVYGLLHPEPVAYFRPVSWFAPSGWSPAETDYYAAQGNATRIFLGKKFASNLVDWKQKAAIRFSAISYVASGGYSGPQLYPRSSLPLVKSVESICDRFPFLFATRLLVVLEKME